MAYMSQEKKAKMAPAIKAICAKYKVKASLSVHNHSSLELNIKSSPIDFIGNFNATMEVRPGGFRNDSKAKDSLNINQYWYDEHFTGKALEFLTEIVPAMNMGNHDNSDIQSDYFDVGFYVSINVGKWNKPYKVA